MNENKLSLTKKLDGGYLHVKKRDSNVQKRTGGGYSNYLKRNQKKESTIQQGGDTTRKVVSIKLGGKKPSKKNKTTQKPPSIPILHVVTDRPEPKQSAKEPKQAAKEPKQAAKEPKQVTKGIPVVMPKVKGSLKKRHVSRTNRSSGRGRSKGLRRSLTKRRQHDLKKGKRISVTKIRKLSNKEVTSIQSKLKSIKGKSTSEIKKELDKQGIQVSGKSANILKDIYMYSQLCGINIKRE